MLAKTLSLEAGPLGQVPAGCFIAPGTVQSVTIMQDASLNIYLFMASPVWQGKAENLRSRVALAPSAPSLVDIRLDGMHPCQLASLLL